MLKAAASFRNQGFLIQKAALKEGWEVEERDVAQAARFRKERWDRMIMVGPLWPRYVFDIQRITAPWFSHSHCIYGPVDGPYTMNINFFMIFRQMNIATPSQWCKNQIEKAGIPVKSVIPHGIDPKDFRFSKNPKYSRMKDLRAKYKDKTIFFSNLNPLHRKGFPQLMQALQILQNLQKDKWVFILHTGLKNAVKHGLTPGKVPNLVVEDAYNKLPFRQIALKTVSCDAYVQPSLNEGFGLPILEAAAAKTCVVMCDCPAQNEILGPEEAWLFPYDDIKTETWTAPGCVAQLHRYNPESLARAMELVITHPEASREKAEKAYKRSKQFHYLKVYKPLVEMPE